MPVQLFIELHGFYHSTINIINFANNLFYDCDEFSFKSRMLIHLFGFPSSGGLGAGYDSSPQASSCTCELKWSDGGQRQYCGGGGGERILHL